MADNAKTVLIIDDDPAVCELSRRFLENHHYRALTVSDPAGALKTLDVHRPDLILLDIHLAGEDGLLFLARLKANALMKGIPVIMLTAHAGRDLVARAIRTGAVDYIVKPFQGPALIGRIARAMQIGDLERARATAAETSVQLDRRGGVAKLLLTGTLEPTTLDRLRRVFSPAVKLQAKNDEIVLDLRFISIEQPASIAIVAEMLQHLKPAETRIVAGRNYAGLLALDLAIEEQLFLSADDLVQWLKFRETQKR